MSALRKKAASPAEAADLALRVSVDAGGCSGFQYKIELTSKREAVPGEDLVVERDGLIVLCDGVSLELLKGSTIDYEESLMRAAFVVAGNPNAAQSCGCGSSFAAKG
jgi:iron-sulfur cluster assembly accessory protein